MQRGRKPVSNKIKELRGTLKPSRMKSGLKLPTLAESPPAPDYFSDEMKALYKAVTKQLIEMDVMTKVDQQLIEMYVFEMNEFRTAVRQLQKAENYIEVSQSGYKQPSPWLAVKNQAIKHLKELGSLFGFDPISRMRFNMEEPEQENELLRLLRETREVRKIKSN